MPETTQPSPNPGSNGNNGGMTGGTGNNGGMTGGTGNNGGMTGGTGNNGGMTGGTGNNGGMTGGTGNNGGMTGGTGGDTTGNSTTPGGTMPTDRAGSDIQHARNLGRLTSRLSATDTVSLQDETDVYKFTLAQNADVAISLASAGSNVDLAILDSTGETLASSDSADQSGSSVSENLDPGTYYAQVSHVSGFSRYTLRINRSIPDGAGDTVATARNIGELDTSPTRISDSIGGTDPLDIYRFSLDRPSEFTVRFTGLTRELDVTLVRPNGSTIQSTSVDSADNSVTRNLAAGTYFFGIESSAAASTYRAAFSARPVSGGSGSSGSGSSSAGGSGSGSGSSGSSGGSGSSEERMRLADVLTQTAALSPLSGSASSTGSDSRQKTALGWLVG